MIQVFFLSDVFIPIPVIGRFYKYFLVFQLVHLHGVYVYGMERKFFQHIF